LRVTFKSWVIDYSLRRVQEVVILIFEIRVIAVFISQGFVVIRPRLFLYPDGRGVLVYLLPSFLGEFREVLLSL